MWLVGRLHPVLVHFPIGLVLAAAAAELIAIHTGRPAWRTIAVANLLSFVGVALQPLAQYGMLRLGHPDPSRVFLVAAAMTLLMGIVLLRMMPDLGVRALGWTRFRSRATL